MLPGLDPAELPADAVEVGRIQEAWGIQGWFKVMPFSADPEALFSSKKWFLLPSDRGIRSFEGVARLAIRQAKIHSGTVVAQAADIDERNVAELLRGARIFIPRSSFPTAQKDEYYWIDLIGLTVVNREGLILGQVRELLSTGPQTVLVIDDKLGEKPLERMIPFVAAYVDDVDLQAKRIAVDWQADY
jgi:16S rRNA processing protein RimM